ncbi:hypothetical protein COMA2_110098 [Candidatus Nitrospira nitrificans]|uniref:Uncharacterized protein n=1 Tax=Candidatus Nitrospira nitrificans TaxID=1742973 RepID=A0A0S4L524_9BACT|nr:hypothetical protein COMA2_110098 [Candidatus Nitrospira nitrificans]
MQITVHDQVIAEIRAVEQGPAPRAATTLLRLMAKMPTRRTKKVPISSHVKSHLYGPRGAIC